MPLYSDHISNMYYGASPSYSSLPYGYSSSVSSLGPSYSASYLNPGGSYSNHSSISGYSRTPLTSRWISGVGRNYSPMLSTISERGSASPVRINSPRRIPITTRSYGTSSYTTRPININTADIDVSKDKYRHKTETVYTATPPRRESPKTESENENGPFMPRVDGKPETGIDSSPGSTERSTIKRGRTVVRLYTIKRKERDSPRKPQEDLQSKETTTHKNSEEASIEECKNVKKEKKWREKLSDDLAYKEKKEKKSLGTKLMEKFTVKENNDKELENSTKMSEETEKPQNLPTNPTQNISIPSNMSLDRRCSLELLAEQAHLLDSLIRSENLSTVSLDLSKVGVVNEHKNNSEADLLKRRRSNDLHNPLKTTKSDHSLHDNLKSYKDPRKRRSIKKSASGGSICRLDSITEFPREPINMKLPAIEESRLSIKQETTKQKPKPKLKTKITSSVEVSAPMSPLKFKVENVVVENVIVAEKPRVPRKGITYSSEVEIISSSVPVEKESGEKSNKITATVVDLESPEPADGNFWDKIGKRETVYLMKRKQNLDEAKEKHKRALFWFPEEEETGNNDESDIGPKIKMAETNGTESKMNIAMDDFNTTQKDCNQNIGTPTQIEKFIINKHGKPLSNIDLKSSAVTEAKTLKHPHRIKNKVLEDAVKNPDTVDKNTLQSVDKPNKADIEKDKDTKTFKSEQCENAESSKYDKEHITTTGQTHIVDNHSKASTYLDSNVETVKPQLKTLNDGKVKILEESKENIVDIKTPAQELNQVLNAACTNKNRKDLKHQPGEKTKVPKESSLKIKSFKERESAKATEIKFSDIKIEKVIHSPLHEISGADRESSLINKTSCDVINTRPCDKEKVIGKSASMEIVSDTDQVSSDKKTKSENLKKIRKKDSNSAKSDKQPLQFPLPKPNNKDKRTNVPNSDSNKNITSLSRQSSGTEKKSQEDISEQQVPQQVKNDSEKELNEFCTTSLIKRNSIQREELPKPIKTDDNELLKNEGSLKSKSEIEISLVTQKAHDGKKEQDVLSSHNETKIAEVLEIPIVVKSQDIPIKESLTETILAVDAEQKTGEEKKAENISQKEEQQQKLDQAAASAPTFTPKNPVKEQKALKPLIATPRPLQKRAPQVIHSSDSESSSEEESSEEDDDSDTSEEDSTEFFECENNGDGRTSTGSNDSGFDSSAPTSPATFMQIKKDCDVNCHRKCEKLTANLCGVNQRLLVEALASRTASKKGGDTAGASTSKAPAQCNNTDIVEQELEQSTAYDLFRKTGRFTPPARSIPRFRKYTVEDFQFIKVLGKGSFGKVLLAELRDTEYYYAVKCLKKDVVLEDDDVECTLIERKVLALGTNHPYLCHLFATFQTDSHLFFVMEYLNGGDLMFHIQQSGRFPEARARFYAAEIVSGLKFLHKRGIVYRDLKLDNILLDYEGHVRIADFGMCKLQIYLDKTADTFCGTPDYMAPEIIKGLKYNQTVDWWSFGVLLYEMLIGQSPFSGCDEDELFWSICNEMPSYPRFLSTEALTILTRLLDKDARSRLGGTECMHGDIREQPFFHPIHWDRLERRDLEAPFRPRVRHPMDTQYFDRAFTGERPRLTAVEPHVLRSMDQEPFRGFSYTNPNTTDR